MQKILLIAFVFAFIFTIQAQEPQYCNFTIRSIPKTNTTQDEVTTDIFARIETINQTVPLVQQGNLTVSNLANNVGSVEYEGTNCTCTIKLYSKADFIGSYVYFNLKNRTSGVINFSPTWSQKIQSYQFYY